MRYAGARHERGALLYEASLRLDLATGDALQANPHVGVVWRPGAGSTRLRASVGRASKLPSFFALASPPALGGNPALQPEHAWGGEAGVEHRFAPARLDVGAAYFRQEYSNLVDFDFDRFLHVNRARVRTQGVEMTARWQPHATVWLDAEATWLDVQDLETGGTLLHTPGWTGGGRLTWQPEPGLQPARPGEGHGGLPRRAVSRCPTATRSTATGSLGVAGSWRFGRGLSIRARADNLTGTSYETYIGFPGPGRAFWVGLGWDR